MTADAAVPARGALPAWLVAACVALAGFTIWGRLGSLPLLDPDEGRNAGVASEMLDRGAWIVPSFDGLPYMDKPAIFFRAVALSFASLGRNEAAARLPSALAATALLAAAYGFCRRVYGSRVAALAVAVVGTAPLYVVLARTVIFDMPLALCVSISIFAGYLAEEGPTPCRRWATASALSAGVATLVKGPVGFALPLLVLSIFFLVDGRGAAARRVVGGRQLGVLFAVVLPWFVAACIERPDFAHYGLIDESLKRFTTDAFHRTQPFYFYLPVMAVGLLPWSAAVPEAIWLAWTRRARLERPDRLFLVWTVVVGAFFSASHSKLAGYVLTAVLAAGVLIARLVDRALAGDHSRSERILFRALLGLATAAGIGAVLGLSSSLLGVGIWERVLGKRNYEIVRLAPLFAPLAVTFAALAALAGRAYAKRRLAAAALVVVVVPISLLTLCFPALRRYTSASSARDIAEAVAREAGSAYVVCVHSLPPGLPFYLHRTVGLITEDGHETTSNYVMHSLRSSAAWPEQMIRAGEADRWLESRREPVYLLTYWRRYPALAALLGSRTLTPIEIAPGWWGVRVPAAES